MSTPTTLTYLSHAGFLIQNDKHTIVVDPWLTGNEKAARTVAELPDPDYVLITHGHNDHYGPDTWALCNRADAPLIAPYEVCAHAQQHGEVKNIEPGNPGGNIYTDFGYVAFTPAIHSSSYDGQYMGACCGFVIHFHGVTIYHAGDTALFSDMKLIGEVGKPDIALLPAGDRFTMSPKLAAKAAELVGAPIAVPIHWGTFGMITDDISDFKPNGIEARVMQPGDSIELQPS